MAGNFIIRNARVLTPGGFITADLFIKNGVIDRITEEYRPDGGIPTWDVKKSLVLPGFIDVHTHGAAGVDINAARPEDYDILGNFYASQGTTAYQPTIVSDTNEHTVEMLRSIAAAKGKSKGSRIVGIHVEGPYLSVAHKGAMSEEFLRGPSLEEFDAFQQAAEGNVKMMTIAPELHGAAEFIRIVSKTGVTLSCGHTGATYERIQECIHNGMTHVTHAFNGMKMMHHRAPSVVGAVLDSDMTAQIIPDGAHTHPAMVRILLRTKGVDQVVGITDSIMATGLSDGRYSLGAHNVDVINGDAWLAHDHSTRAGSTLGMVEGFRRFINFTGCSVADASKVFSRNPAREIGLERSKGEIRTGYDADLVLLDDQYKLRATMVDGEWVYKAK